MHRRLLTLAATIAIALLIFVTLTWTSAAAPAHLPSGQTVPPVPTVTPTAITVTMWTYDDANNNRWRDENEPPYLPDFFGTIYCYNFYSEACQHDSPYYCLIEGDKNTAVVPSACTYSVRRLYFFGLIPSLIGSFTAGTEPLALYFPSNSALCCPPDNLLGTPTPTQTSTSTPTHTPSPTVTPTPTPSMPEAPVSTPTNTPIVTEGQHPTPSAPDIQLPFVQN